MFRGLLAELKSIWQNKLLILTLIVICFIPSLYAGVFLRGVWDPYNNLKEIPVAVVNKDKAVQFNGQTISIGDKITEQLKNSKIFKWDIVSEEQAQKGMRDNHYYVSYTIPENFSQNATSINSANPQKMNFHYQTNGSMNLPVETMAMGVTEQLKSQIKTEVDLSYARAMLQVIQQTGSSLQLASDGANQITDGSNQLGQGLYLLKGGTTDLSQATKQLSNGANKLNDGIKQLLSQTKQGANQLNKSLPSFNKLNIGASQIADSLAMLSPGLVQLATAAQNKAQLTNDPNDIAMAQQLTALSNGLAGLAPASKQLSDGVDQAYQQLNNLSQSISSDQAKSKLDQLGSGSQALADGLSKLDAATPKLDNGVNKLITGNRQLGEGSSTLSTKLAQGADKINSAPLGEATAQQIADPITSQQSKLSEIPNYGHGLSPFFLSVSIYVGCMVFCFAYPLRNRLNPPNKWYAWYFSRVLIGSLTATIMSIILCGIMQLLGLQVHDVGQFYLTAILFANAIIFFTMALALAFDNPGRFVAMVILVFSLGASGGTFPIETATSFYQSIHPFVPLTYSLTGLRSSIAGGINQSAVLQSYLVIIGILIVSLILVAITCYVLDKKAIGVPKSNPAKE